MKPKEMSRLGEESGNEFGNMIFDFEENIQGNKMERDEKHLKRATKYSNEYVLIDFQRNSEYVKMKTNDI